MALAAFAWDFSGIRRFAERDHANIVCWNSTTLRSRPAARTTPAATTPRTRPPAYWSATCDGSSPP
jgi:hypothetical protein